MNAQNQNQNLIQNFRTFLNTAHAQLMRNGMSEDQADQMLEEVDTYEFYCQNTTLESEADPIRYAQSLLQTV